jgi:hypothetical protein
MKKVTWDKEKKKSPSPTLDVVTGEQGLEYARQLPKAG